MAENVIHVRGTRAQLRQALAKLPQMAKESGPIADAMMTHCGLALLGRIKLAFIVKSRGGTDEAGERWKPLSKRYVAYGRRHPGVPKASVRALSRPSWMLDDKQRERWWDLYRQWLAVSKGDKSAAAARAWTVLKAEGAETLFDKYGNTKVDILRDTGLLLNSLSPGVSSSEQVFKIGRGEVIVGTNRKHAVAHHEGRGNLPQRRLWPAPRNWPASWWRDIAMQARAGLIDIIKSLLRS